MASPIRSIHAEEIKDSRGKPTLRVFVKTEKAKGDASVPAGASVGRHEAKAVDAAVAIANVGGEIAVALAGKRFDQQSLDRALCELDGTPDKSRLGGNALLGVSMAFARAAAEEGSQPLYAYLGALAGTTPALPCPMFNLINGGKHARGGLDLQEYLLVPSGIDGMRARLDAGVACAVTLKLVLDERGIAAQTGDEGGYAPLLQNNEAALELLAETRSRAGFDATQIKLSLDAAASSFFTDGTYLFSTDGMTRTAPELCDYWVLLAERYGLLSIEDPFAEDDQASFAALQQKTRALIVGDDLTVTQAPRIAQAARAGAIRAVILKPNQVGTVSETIEAAHAARGAGLTLIASHRSGETKDTFIADFAAGVACEYLKAGAPTAPERIAKYNRLVAIEKELSTA